MVNKQSRMEAIARDIIENHTCPELADQATQLVMGGGNLNADLVFIGEAPGKKEDESGRPFVGASGKFLNELLAQVGMTRDDIYITNIVKYRPPNNRDPSTLEKRAFLPYLLRQLDIIQPKVIVTLGRHSMEYFLPGLKISDVHGRPLDVRVEGRAFMILPLYHPAAALYNGSLRATLIEDFSHVPELLTTLQD